jgi:hypothetical protein
MTARRGGGGATSVDGHERRAVDAHAAVQIHPAAVDDTGAVQARGQERAAQRRQEVPTRPYPSSIADFRIEETDQLTGIAIGEPFLVPVWVAAGSAGDEVKVGQVPSLPPAVPSVSRHSPGSGARRRPEALGQPRMTTSKNDVPHRITLDYQRAPASSDDISNRPAAPRGIARSARTRWRATERERAARHQGVAGCEGRTVEGETRAESQPAPLNRNRECLERDRRLRRGVTRVARRDCSHAYR